MVLYNNIKELKFDSNGLIPAVIQDYYTILNILNNYL